MSKKIAICAGGTGGHINAALSLGEMFHENGFEVVYFTGTRYLDYQLFGKQKLQVYHLDAKPLRSKDALGTLKNMLLNLFCFLTTFSKFLARRPAAVLGAGGYICGPTLAAAKLLGVKTYILEQNAVAGLTNRLLSKFSDKIFLNFENTKGIDASAKTIVTGNPVRSSIKASPNHIADELKILVFGGSLGAKQINEAIGSIASKDWGFPISIVHQTGKGNLKDVSLGSKVSYRQSEYFDNMDELYSWANIVVCRAGASTISELRIAKRPAILVPYPFATDDHQTQNAIELRREENFYVKVVDPNLSAAELEKSVLEGIEEIREKELFQPYKEASPVSSRDLIFKEVMKDVRNK